MKYHVVIPNWYDGVLTCEMVNGKEIVIHAPKHMAWAIGKPTLEAFAFYGSRPGATINQIAGKRKLRVVRKKRRVIRIRKRKL